MRNRSDNQTGGPVWPARPPFSQSRAGHVRRRGFTLLEVMLAVAIVGTALFGIAMAIGRCMDAAKATDNYTVAHDLLEDKLQEFSNSTNFVTGLSNGDFGDDYPNYRWSRDVEPDDSQMAGLYQQVITVTWRDRSHDVDVTLNSMIFNPTADTGDNTNPTGQPPASSNPRAAGGS